MAPPAGELKQSLLDQEHLRLLALFYRITAGITALFACIPLLHLSLGIFFVLAPKRMPSGASGMPPSFIGWFFIICAAIIIFLGWSLALANFFTAKFIQERRRLTFCQVVAGINCLFIPYGTIQGVSTLMVLNRNSVSQLFSSPRPNNHKE